MSLVVTLDDLVSATAKALELLLGHLPDDQHIAVFAHSDGSGSVEIEGPDEIHHYRLKDSKAEHAATWKRTA